MPTLQLLALACDRPEDPNGDTIRLDVRDGNGGAAVASSELRRMIEGKLWDDLNVEVRFDARATVDLMQVTRNHSLGRLEVTSEPTSTTSSPWSRFTWHNTHYTLRYRIVGDGASEESDPDDLACCEIELPEGGPPLPVARRELQRLVLSGTTEEEIRRWPRYAMARESGGSTQLYIFRPDGTGRRRFRPFSRTDFRAYLQSVGRQPDISNASTWGSSQRLTLQVCYLVTGADGRREIVFDAADRVEWTWEVFNLDSSQDRWLKLLDRTLMLFPIEYLRAGRFKTLYLDFFVGNERLGPNSRVGSGGANFHLGQRTREGLTPPDPAKLNVVAVTYAGLNRAWSQGRGGLPTTDAGIDAAFDDMRHVAYTIYHEFAHIYQFYDPRFGDDFTDRAEYEREVQYQAAINAHSRNRPGELWDQYREAIEYNFARRPTEGFAEAFRKRMQGRPVGGGDMEAEVERVLDEIGMPTRESVLRAREAITRSLTGS